MQMSGLLETFPPAELLQWAHNDRLTGTVVLRRSSREKRILLRDGRIVNCLSNEPFEFYGEYLLAMGHITESQLLSALSHCEQRRGQLRLGEALIDLDLLDRDTVVETLVERNEQMILDLFLWPRGVFFVLEDEPPSAALEIPPIEPIGLIFEGVRQIDEVARIRERLPHDSVVLRAGAAWPGANLSPIARRIIGVFEPDRTLAQLHNATGGGQCLFLTELDRLVRSDVLAIERLGEAAPDTQTLSLLDIMLDRIQEERQAAIGGTVAMPLSALGELFPLWLDRGDRVAVDAGAESVRAFGLSLDGTRKLGSLLGSDTRRREAQLEWLWSCIGARRLVLLPYPADEDLRRRLTERTPPD